MWGGRRSPGSRAVRDRPLAPAGLGLPPRPGLPLPAAANGALPRAPSQAAPAPLPAVAAAMPVVVTIKAVHSHSCGSVSLRNNGRGWEALSIEPPARGLPVSERLCTRCFSRAEVQPATLNAYALGLIHGFFWFERRVTSYPSFSFTNFQHECGSICGRLGVT